MTEFINLHTHRTEKSDNVFSVVNLTLPHSHIPPNVCFSAGWHPWYINGIPFEKIEASISTFLQNKKMIALGECGFDRTTDIPIQFQTSVFNLHVKLANENGKPVIVHCVRAYSDLLHYLKESKPITKFIVHGYNANIHVTEQLLHYNIYFSLGKDVLNPNSKILDILKLIPLNKLFFETDEAGFSVSDIYIRASELLNVSVEKLADQIRTNFNEVFGYGLVEQDPFTGR